MDYGGWQHGSGRGHRGGLTLSTELTWGKGVTFLFTRETGENSLKAHKVKYTV